jgi:phosphoribosylamine--glycine ligase
LRFLGVGYYCELGDLYIRLAREGHDVRVHVAGKESRETLAGMIERVDDWRTALPWIAEAGDGGIILFERADAGKVQDDLRREGYRVVGGSALGDRLEGERGFGQEVLRSAGIATVPTFRFRDFDAGAAHIRSNPRRYVYKPNGFEAPSQASYVGDLADGEDVVDFLAWQRSIAKGKAADFILMPHLSGVEVGVGAYFNGAEFLTPACIDFEHKRFFNGDMGELTGEMGTVASYRGAERLFERTLARLAPLLARSGYCGYINLNTIVDGDGIWPLEFTSRFGYPGFAILDPLHRESWADIFARLCARDGTGFATHDGFSVGIVLTVPPFPYESTYPASPARLPVRFREPLGEDEQRHVHYGEVALDDGRLVTAGVIGQVMVVTGCGATVAEARDAAYRLAGKVSVPNLRYRTDIGHAVTDGLGLLRRWGVVQ